MIVGDPLGALRPEVLNFTMDWNYQPVHLASTSAYLHQENFFKEDIGPEEDDDDDIDSYYMDLPPIDMTERLKEVNRALAEDATPVESKRTIKIRFREDIADFQSPPDTDSDDGYGDSSEIMCDAEEENENLLQPSSSKEAMDFLLGTSSKTATSTFLPLSITSFCSPPHSNAPMPSPNVETLEFSKEADSDSERGSSHLMTRLELAIPKLETQEDSIDGLPESSYIFNNSNSSFHKKDESDIEEEEIEEDILDLTPKSEDDSESIKKSRLGDSRHRDKVQSQSEDVSTLSSSLPLPSNENDKTKKQSSLQDKESKLDCLPKADLSNEETGSNKKTTKKLKSKTVETSERGRSKQRTKHLSITHPIPSIKPALLDSYRGTEGISTSKPSSDNFKISSKTKSKSLSASKSPLTSPVQSTNTARERPHSGSSTGSRTRPYRSVKTIDHKKPVKALHSLNHLDSGSHSSLRPQQEMQFQPSRARIRKSASITDLRRGADEHDVTMRENVYKAWLTQKNEKAAAIKRQQEQVKASEEAAAKAKFAERKMKAEEAFQQWLKRKREQLKLEKKMRSHQRRIDQQASYARTRSQCEDAYKEWCSRKKEEVAARRSSGTSVRSRSLERSWIQEKTRKLYSAYLNK